MKNNYKKITLGSFVYKNFSIKIMLCILGIFLLPQICMLFITKSFASLMLILVTILASILVDVICSYLKKENCNLLYYSLIGCFIGFFLPSNYPPVIVFFITFFTLLLLRFFFAKEFSWINPIALVVFFLFLIAVPYFVSYKQDTFQTVYLDNSLQNFITSGKITVFALDFTITDWLNSVIFTKLGFTIPYGYMTLFWDSQSIVPAFRFNCLTLISSLFFFGFSFFTSIIPVIVLTIYLLLVKTFGAYSTTLQYFQGDMLFSVLTCGVLFTIVFLIEWFGTIPTSLLGKIFYGILTGMILFFFVGTGNSAVGAILTLVLANIVSLIIQFLEHKYIIFTENRLSFLKADEE